MKTKIKIEPITSAAIFDECALVMMDAYNRPPWKDDWTRETAAAVLNCYYNSPEFMGWVAGVDEKVVGVGVGNVEPHCSGPIFYLKELLVAFEWQHVGVGSLLIAAMKQDLELAGIKTVILFTSDDILPFYSKCGFNEMEGRRTMIYER